MGQTSAALDQQLSQERTQRLAMQQQLADSTLGRVDELGLLSKFHKIQIRARATRHSRPTYRHFRLQAKNTRPSFLRRKNSSSSNGRRSMLQMTPERTTICAERSRHLRTCIQPD